VKAREEVMNLAGSIVAGMLFLAIGILWQKVNQIAVSLTNMARVADKRLNDIENRLSEVESRLEQRGR
jgi:hypothetical protein